MDTGTGPYACHCCAAPPAAAPVYNEPGLPALRYRVDSYPGFRARLLQNLPLARPDESQPDPRRPLAGLLARDSAEPSVALIDAFSCVADVLSFYQERIANEGYLRTATERRSVLELARAVGYELAPGLAAAVHLAFTVEDAQGAPQRCTLAAGLAVQSVPPQGKLPQVFETSVTIEARAQWNALRARQARPAGLALLQLDDDGVARTALVLAGPKGSFPSGTEHLHAGIANSALARLDPGALPLEPTVDAIEVRRIYCTEAAAGIAKGALVLFAGHANGRLATLVQRVVAAEVEPARKRVRLDLEPLPALDKPKAPSLAYTVIPYGVAPRLAGTGASGPALLAGARRAQPPVKAHAAFPAAAVLPSAVAPADGVFAFDTHLGFFGCNAPKWGSLPREEYTNGHYDAGWDSGDPRSDPGQTPGNGQALDAPRTIWTDSQGAPLAPAHAYLERPAPGLVRASWMVFEAPEYAPQACAVFDAREESRADYGLSGRAMALVLADEHGRALPATVLDGDGNPRAPDQLRPFRFRGTTAHVGSRALALAELPIEAPVAAGTTRVELDSPVPGLGAGQPLAFVGKSDDLSGNEVAEIAVLDAAVEQGDGHTMLVLRAGLQHGYLRADLRISANVVHATHGESVAETLGGGDGAQAHQRFVLKKPPTTFLSASTPRGARSTLEVRVGGVRWDEVPSLHGMAPDSQVYVARIDDDGRMELVFGDGVQGARLPSGIANVAARYRSGLGPDGEVARNSLTLLRAMPLGLREVTNPVPASGAAAPERLADARRNAPLAVRTFERVVSLADYADFAQGFPGIAQARGDLAWVNGEARVFISVTGDTSPQPGDEVLAHLAIALAEAGDGARRFIVRACQVRYFGCGASVVRDPRYPRTEVLAAVAARLRAAFGFGARALAQPVTAAEVLAVIHEVDGVVAADLTRLSPQPDASRAPVVETLPARAAYWDPSLHRALPAELLLIQPDAIEVREMAP